MANFNKVIMAGRLTRDPQMTYLPSQTAVVEFGLATNRRWNDRATGQQREETCFVDCRCFGRQAEVVNQYLRKGASILIEGRLQLDTWEGKDGVRRSKHRIMVDRFEFLDSRQSAGQAGAPPPPQPAPPPQAPAAPPPQAPAVPPPQAPAAPPPQAPAAPPPQAPAPPTAPLAPPEDLSEPPPPDYAGEGEGEEIPF